MRLFVNILEFLNSVVCVNLRGSKTGVTQQLLYGIDLGSVIKHVSSKGVSQNMRILLVAGGDHADILLYCPVNEFWIHLVALSIKEQMRGRCVCFG